MKPRTNKRLLRCRTPSSSLKRKKYSPLTKSSILSRRENPSLNLAIKRKSLLSNQESRKKSPKDLPKKSVERVVTQSTITHAVDDMTVTARHLKSAIPIDLVVGAQNHVLVHLCRRRTAMAEEEIVPTDIIVTETELLLSTNEGTVTMSDGLVMRKAAM